MAQRKIGIITFHAADNYGAVLQAYALQKFIGDSLAAEVYIVAEDDQDEIFKKYHLSFALLLKQILRGSVRSALRWVLDYSRSDKFAAFRLKYLKVGRFKEDTNLLVYGSDQIWNYNIVTSFESRYFGRTEAKCVSYAASAGGNFSALDKNACDKIATLFSKVSVREKSLADHLKRFNVESQVVVDPVFLLSSCDWNELVQRKFEESPYLLFYSVEQTDWQLKYAKDLAKQMNLKFVHIDAKNSLRSALSGAKFPSVEAFVTYFRNADFVVTTSFHGTAFSLIFNKNFLTLSVNDNVDERSRNILRICDKEESFIEQQCQRTVGRHTITNKSFEELVCISKDYLKAQIDE